MSAELSVMEQHALDAAREQKANIDKWFADISNETSGKLRVSKDGKILSGCLWIACTGVGGKAPKRVKPASGKALRQWAVTIAAKSGYAYAA